jgi:hypothetical protein
MGCDIHLFVETRDPGGPWMLTRVELPCGWCDGTAVSTRGEACYGCRAKPKVEVGYSDRCYDTFAILANVRNGSGFGGISTGGGFISIAEPRGLPDDMSAELKQLIARNDDDEPAGAYETLRAKWGATWIGDHSHTHLSLDELLKFNWRQVATKTGWVSLEEFRKWDAKGGGWPDGWCGGISGQRIRHVTNEAMRKLIAAGRVESDDSKWDEDRHYTLVRWTDTYAACSGRFHDKFIPALVALGKPPGDVRIVFGFDS